MQKDKDDCYRVVYGDAVGDAASVNIATIANLPAIEPKQCWKALLKAGNGNDADIADIALQQLMDREVQDS